MIYLQDPDFTLYCGDVLAELAAIPDESVHSVVTSPPYWGLRDYGTGSWEGGDPDCDHSVGGQVQDTKAPGAITTGQRPGVDASICRKCGARRVDKQLGLEATPDLYVARMVEVFREVRRVLRTDGSLWLNLGDSYAQQGAGVQGASGEMSHRAHTRRTFLRRPTEIKPKDLVGIPWRVAFALQQPYYTGRIKDERDRIWLAAMVEAEGCMFIHRRKAGSDSGSRYTRKDGTEISYERTQDTFGVGLEVSSTDRVIVERCLAITGLGSICEQGPAENARRKQTLYRWNLRTNECRDVVRELYPHLLAKRHEARLLVGCPSSGDDARKAWESLKALHQGQAARIDFGEPEGMWERGWYLRSEIIWSKKPNPMPESVTDRPTKAHEQIFLLTKSPRYFFDQEAVREPAEWNRWGDQTIGPGSNPDGWIKPKTREELNANRSSYKPGQTGGNTLAGHEKKSDAGLTVNPAGRNVRSVWSIPTQPYAEAHFATFPEELVRRCVLAGTSERGCCPECGAPWVREVETESTAKTSHDWRDRWPPTTDGHNTVQRGGITVQTTTLGWHPTCDHDHQAVPCTILDPFMGSGTTAYVARAHNRHAIGIELNEDYCELIAKRCQQQGLPITDWIDVG